MRRKRGIYGAGGFGRELEWLLLESSDGAIECAAFIDDAPDTLNVHGASVVSLEAFRLRFPGVPVLLSPGNGETRMRLAERILGLVSPPVFHRSVRMSNFVSVGAGTVVCAGCTLTTEVLVGEHVQINLNCTIGHDCIVHDFVTMAPGVHVSGYVHIGQGAYLGTGAVVINGTASKPLRIGRGAVIGAGAVVVRDVPDGETHVGVPARKLQPRP